MTTWDCEAYGPGGEAVDALCFFAEPGTRPCSTQTECQTRLAGERARVFGRIQELAASGDPAGRYLAGEFTDPEQLLGGVLSSTDDDAVRADLIESDQLFLVAADGGDVHLYRIDADWHPVELAAADSPRHGRGSLGHGYTSACDPTGEQCNNSQCRAGRNHDRCTPACSGETYWDDLGPWQIAPARREAFLAALGRSQ